MFFRIFLSAFPRFHDESQSFLRARADGSLWILQRIVHPITFISISFFPNSILFLPKRRLYMSAASASSRKIRSLSCKLVDHRPLLFSQMRSAGSSCPAWSVSPAFPLSLSVSGFRPLAPPAAAPPPPPRRACSPRANSSRGSPKTSNSRSSSPALFWSSSPRAVASAGAPAAGRRRADAAPTAPATPRLRRAAVPP